MRHITVVLREIDEVKTKIKYGENTKEQAKALQMRLLELQKERQAINWS